MKLKHTRDKLEVGEMKMRPVGMGQRKAEEGMVQLLDNQLAVLEDTKKLEDK